MYCFIKLELIAVGKRRGEARLLSVHVVPAHPFDAAVHFLDSGEDDDGADDPEQKIRYQETGCDPEKRRKNPQDRHKDQHRAGGGRHLENGSLFLNFPFILVYFLHKWVDYGSIHLIITGTIFRNEVSLLNWLGEVIAELVFLLFPQSFQPIDQFQVVFGEIFNRNLTNL